PSQERPGVRRRQVGHELFPFYVYTDEGAHILDLDGAGVDTFGIDNFACHLTACLRANERPQDSRTGFRGGRGRSAVFRVCWITPSVEVCARERVLSTASSAGQRKRPARLPEAITGANSKACGTVSFTMTRGASTRCSTCTRWRRRDIQCYLVSFDGEADGVLRADDAGRGEGRFKLNCDMPWMAFLIQREYVDAEDETCLTEICARLHRNHDLVVV
ncbi:hypothetical protein BDV95DRAFT_249056, partial [Massariosphaeria phaeospora]